MFKSISFVAKSATQRFVLLAVFCGLVSLAILAALPVIRGENSSPTSAKTDDAGIFAPAAVKTTVQLLMGDPTPTPTADAAHTLVGAFYDVQNFPTAKLLLNNKDTISRLVHPTLYNLNGDELTIPPVTIAPDSATLIDLNQWVSGADPSFQKGSIKLFHKGRDLVIGAQTYLSDELNSQSFEERFGELTKFDSRNLESIWWMPDNQTEVKIFLSNTSAQSLTVKARLSHAPDFLGVTETFILAPHETRILDLRTDFTDGGDCASFQLVGLSLEQLGEKSDLKAHGQIKNASLQYSNIISFSNPNSAKSSELHGVGMHFGAYGVEVLEPMVAVKNVGTEDAIVTAKVPYTRTDGTTATITLAPVSLRSNEMNFLDMTPVIQVGQKEENIEIASIEVEYDTPPGSVIVNTQSQSQNGRHSFRVPMYDIYGQTSSTGGYPWRIEPNSSTFVYIKNTTDLEQAYVAYLTWAGGNYMIGLQTIPAHKTVQIDVKKLRDEQIPDERGNTIPINLAEGQIKWTQHEEIFEENQTLKKFELVGRSEQIDFLNGISSSYACQNCCLKTAVADIYTDGISEAAIGEQLQFRAHEVGTNCYGEPYSYLRTSGVNWSSLNTNIATVNQQGLVTIVNAGNAQIKAQWSVQVSNNYGTFCPTGHYLTGAAEGEIEETRDTEENLLPDCTACTTLPRHFSPTAELTAAPNVQKIQYSVNGTWVDVPAGGLGPICNGTSITFKAIPTSGSWSSNRPVWGGDASGTGAQKTVTFSTAGARTVTAKSGNTVSVAVNVGAANANITVTWKSPNVTTTGGSGAATTTSVPFVPEYTACANIGQNEWYLRVKKIEGQTNMTIPTGGYRDPRTSPPVSQPEATDAVDEMNNYYPAGARQSWHTVDATSAHENYHDTEWQCTGNNYWGPTETALELLKVTYTSYNTEAAAITQLRSGTAGADAKVTSFHNISKRYWFSLADNALSRPYAAGQIVLNGDISNVISLAMMNGWTVNGIANPGPNVANPCYEPWLTYNP